MAVICLELKMQTFANLKIYRQLSSNAKYFGLFLSSFGQHTNSSSNRLSRVSEEITGERVCGAEKTVAARQAQNFEF
jgi:hypothetical protein